jgi:hypothetical protein
MLNVQDLLKIVKMSTDRGIKNALKNKIGELEKEENRLREKMGILYELILPIYTMTLPDWETDEERNNILSLSIFIGPEVRVYYDSYSYGEIFVYAVKGEERAFEILKNKIESIREDYLATQKLRLDLIV